MAKKGKLDLSRVSSALQNQTKETKNVKLEETEKIEEKENIPKTDASNLFRVINIPRKKIHRSEKNDWAITQIEKLEWSLLHFGLLEALSVHYDPDMDMYEIESGERRFTALNNLIDRFSDHIPDNSEEYIYYKRNIEQYALNGIPCKIEEDSDPIAAEIRLNIANIEKRPDDPLFLAKKVNDLAKLYAKLNAMLPEEERFSINEKIAEDLGIGKRQVIRNKQFGGLEQDLQDALAETAGINEGSRYHILSPEAQKKLAKDIQETGSLPDPQTAKEIYEQESSESPKNDSKKEPASVPKDKAEALKKAAEIKKAIKGLENQVKKYKKVLESYSDIDPEVRQALNLSDPEEIQREISAIIQTLKIG